MDAKPFFTVIVYLFYPTNCHATHRIVFASYLFLRAIQNLGLKIYSVSTTSTNSLAQTSHLPLPVRHSSADSLSSGSRCVWDSSSSNIIKLTTSLSKENRRDRQWGFFDWFTATVIFDALYCCLRRRRSTPSVYCDRLYLRIRGPAATQANSTDTRKFQLPVVVTRNWGWFPLSFKEQSSSNEQGPWEFILNLKKWGNLLKLKWS